MPRFSITARSDSADYSMKRSDTEDGRDSIFKNQAAAEVVAQAWVDMLNEEKLIDATDWTAIVTKS
jgi:hypothetical protein